MKSLEHLGKTWLIDLDGTITTHNAYLTDGDSLLPKVKQLWSRIRPEDKVIILTARDERYRSSTLRFLHDNELRFDLLVMGLPRGSRILLNDRKPDGTPTAFCLNLERNNGLHEVIDFLETQI